MSNRWSSDANIKFVSLYKNEENLWNVFDKNYKNRDMRRSSLEFICKEMNMISSAEVTKKIKNLRSTYNQEIIKISKSKKSGSAAEELYKPSIKWFEDMDYIMNVINIKEKETTSNLVSCFISIVAYLHFLNVTLSYHFAKRRLLPH